MEKRDTLGGRIQAGRKAAGLSQEALGERLGVSRQAVSKWEADAAVPELENLIAMSRIFGITIGALLGVEPPAGGSAAPGENGPEDGAPDAATEAVPSPTHELTGRELAAAEAIAEKYLSIQSRRSRRWKIAAGAAGIVLVLGVLLGGVLLWSQLQSTQRELEATQYAVEQKIQSASGKFSDILDEKDTIFHDFAIQVTDYDLSEETLKLQISAQAKTWDEGTTGAFTAVLSDGRQFRAEALQQAGTFSVQDWELPMDGEISLSAALTTAGTSVSRPLAALSNSCRPQDLRLDVSGSWGDVSHSGLDPLYVDLKELRFTIQGSPNSWIDWPATFAAPTPTGLDLCFYRNGSAVPELVLPLSDTLSQWQETHQVERRNHAADRAAFDLSPGDTLVSALRVRDDHGDTLWYVLGAFRNQNGIFYDCAVSAEARSTWQPGQSIAPQEP